MATSAPITIYQGSKNVKSKPKSKPVLSGAKPADPADGPALASGAGLAGKRAALMAVVAKLRKA